MYDIQRPAGMAALAAILAAKLATPLAAQPDQLSETYRDWTVSCSSVVAADGEGVQRVCEMRQELRQQDSGQRVLSVALRRDETGGAVMTLVVPFGLNVRGEVEITVGDQALPGIPFETCLPQGCIAGGPLSEAGIEALRRGESAQVALPMISETTFEVPVWECHELCVSGPVHAGFRYFHALKRSSNMIAN